ncbi:MAG: glucose 1-dehydrogenase [Candidatus Dormiibacterota bacterium]
MKAGRLSGKRIVITGAAGGIGVATCRRLATEGAYVIATDIQGDRSRRLAEEIGGEGRALDVTNYEQAVQLAGELGPVDALVNNAGWDEGRFFLDTDPAFWQKVIGINLLGPMGVTHAFARHMAERRQGSIVTVSSDAGKGGSTGETPYAAAKGGLIAFTRSLAREMGRHNVTVNCVCPGPIETAMMEKVFPDERGHHILEAMRRAAPLRRFGQPEDIAACIAYLASDDATYVTGQAISVNGGLVIGA